MKKPYPFPLILGIALVTLPAACSTSQPTDNDPATTATQAPEPEPPARFQVLINGQALEPNAALATLPEKRLVLVGENHERYDHHLNQLALIQKLHQADPRLAIGLEMFQQPAQPQLNAYIAGRLSEQELLEQAGYFEQWGYDYRLYRPILRYAREHGIPLVALNIPNTISRKVGRSGLDSLSAEERRWVPAEIDSSDPAYRERLKAVYDQHRGLLKTDFENFLAAQLLWDEAMAERAARYLRDYPDRRLVILAGNGHLIANGIPRRLQRRRPTAAAVIVQREEGDSQNPDGADYLLVSDPLTLPPAGRLGMMLDVQDPGQGLKIQSVLPDSGAKQAGIQNNDRLMGIGARPVRSMADVRLALLDKRPGDSVPVTIQRSGEAGEMSLRIVLQN